MQAQLDESRRMKDKYKKRLERLKAPWRLGVGRYTSHAAGIGTYTGHASHETLDPLPGAAPRTTCRFSLVPSPSTVRISVEVH